MPNGGVPLRMVLTPPGADGIVHCRGAGVRVVPHTEWDDRGTAADPIPVPNRAEAGVLGRFLRYRLRDAGEGPIYREAGVDVIYDF